MARKSDSKGLGGSGLSTMRSVKSQKPMTTTVKAKGHGGTIMPTRGK